MDSFNIHRFGKTLHWYLSINFRTLLIRIIGIGIFVFLIEFIYWQCMGNVIQNTNALLFKNALYLTGPIFLIFLLGMSDIFYNMEKNSNRESFLMLPASNMEKFCSALLYVTIVWPVGICLSVAIGDTLRMMIRAVAFGDVWASGIPAIMRALRPWDFQHGEWQTVIFMVLMLLFIHSLFILTGTLLRKQAFVVNIVTLCVILVISGRFIYKADETEVSVFAHPLVYVLDVAFIVLISFNYWASYHIFKGFQLITNKWTNYEFHKR